MDGIFSLEPQRMSLSSLGQSRELQLPRTTMSASGSTLGSLERYQRPVPVRSSNLLLVLDAPSAGGEDPVVSTLYGRIT